MGNDRTRCDDRVLAYGHAADDGRAGSDPDVSLYHDGLGDHRGASLRGLKRMARGDDVYVGPDHHVVGDVQAAKVIEGAVLVDEDIAPDTGVGSAGCVERRHQHKTGVDSLADQFTE